MTALTGLLVALAIVLFASGVIVCVISEGLYEKDGAERSKYVLLKGVSFFAACICVIGFIGVVHLLSK